MKYIIPLLACFILFTQCRSRVDVQPTSTFDTLGITWMTIERTNISYYFQGTGEKGASIYTDIYEAAYNELNPIFDAKLPQKLRFFVWTDWAVAEQKLNFFPGFAVPDECVCHVRANQSRGHEMTHVLSYWARGVPPNTYSRFINEGIAVAFDLNEGDKMQRAIQAAAGSGIPSITDLWVQKVIVPDDIMYPIAGAFMQYLYNLNEPEKFYDLMKNQTLYDAQQIYGSSTLNIFINDFDTRLGLR
ncbi:MAG: hypothetical protein KDC11_01210 [Chitinophagaceae bacterium]|nr:hypothetical protein [Chitinophagaceae bacterium]